MLKGSDVRGNLNQQQEMDMNYSIKRYAKICKIAFNRIFPGVRVHIVPGGVRCIWQYKNMQYTF